MLMVSESIDTEAIRAVSESGNVRVNRQMVTRLADEIDSLQAESGRAPMTERVTDEQLAEWEALAARNQALGVPSARDERILALVRALREARADAVRISAAWSDVIQREQRSKSAHFYDMQQLMIERNSLRAEVERLGGAGRCGVAAPVIFPGVPPAWCVLRVGHRGWHRADGGVEWGEADAALAAPTAQPDWLTTDCRRCDDERRAKLSGPASLAARMIVCPECGNKRCPKATWHGNDCTGSNKPGQPGSDYPAAPTGQEDE